MRKLRTENRRQLVQGERKCTIVKKSNEHFVTMLVVNILVLPYYLHKIIEKYYKYD